MLSISTILASPRSEDRGARALNSRKITQICQSECPRSQNQGQIESCCLQHQRAASDLGGEMLEANRAWTEVKETRPTASCLNSRQIPKSFEAQLNSRPNKHIPGALSRLRVEWKPSSEFPRTRLSAPFSLSGAEQSRSRPWIGPRALACSRSLTRSLLRPLNLSGNRSLP
jgi:hypothetical protein